MHMFMSTHVADIHVISQKYKVTCKMFIIRLAFLVEGTIKRLQNEGKLGELKTIVVIVCGGLSVNLEYIAKWKKQTGIVC